MNKKIIIRWIIVLIVIIVIMVVAIIFTRKTEDKKEAYEDYSAEEGLGIEKDSNVKPITSPTMFYTIQNSVRKYLSYVHLDYENQEQEDITINADTLAATYQISTQEEKNEAVYNFLDTDYIKEKSINKDNINQKIKMDTNEVTSCKALKMNMLEGDQIKAYSTFVEVTTKDKEGKEYQEKLYFIVTFDEYNTTYMVKPIENCNDINDIELSIDRNTIQSNKQNKYSFVRVNEGEMSEKYFVQYKEMLLKDPEQAYNLLDQEYREKRFGTFEKFKRFIDNNKEEIGNMYILQYLTNQYDTYTEYVCRDGFQNMYVFEATGVTEYKVKMDTYTLLVEKFMKAYTAADEQKKVVMNIDKWIQMLNNRDYTAAYKVLDETYRNKNWTSEEEFEKYMREKYPSHYTVEYTTFSDENKTYIQDIMLKDINTENKEVIETSIIMQLKDNYEFVMSFEK